MQAECISKIILRQIENKSAHEYVSQREIKAKLGYPPECLGQPENPKQFDELVCINCAFATTSVGRQVCQVVVVGEKGHVILDQWFQPHNQLIDAPEGIKNSSFLQTKKQSYNAQWREKLQEIFIGKILIGYDLGETLNALRISHSMLIDVVDLFPHNFGLPNKVKLKSIVMSELQIPIQWKYPQTLEDAQAIMELVRKHISQGNGRLVEIETNRKIYSDVWDVISEAELDRNKIVGLFLRGSRSLGIAIQQFDYVSDWDYFCVYNTPAKISGKLIKLPEVDITIYDLASFNELVFANDLPCLELFALPKEFQFINKLQKQRILFGPLRKSLGFHLAKCQNKIKRFRKEVLQGHLKFKWKILKAVHLKARFIDLFCQIFENGEIVDPKKMNGLWGEINRRFLQNRDSFNEIELWAEKKVGEAMSHLKTTFHSPSEEMKEEVQKCHETDEMIEPMSSLSIEKQVLKPQPRLQIVQFLKKKGLNALQPFRITYRRHRSHPNLIQLHYLQSANFDHAICRECRGIIVDEGNEYRVVCLPYYKFFDYNDSKYSQLKTFNFNNFRIYEKKDGSIASLYYVDQWHVSSSRIPDGENSYCFTNKENATNFGAQFWRIFNELKYGMPCCEDKTKTFIFQLMSQNHIVIVRRNKGELVLHGVRDCVTLLEEDPAPYAKKYGWEVIQPVEMEVKTIQQIVEITEKLDPIKQEGFVLCDGSYQRMKVKSPKYLRISYLSDIGMSKDKNPQLFIVTEIILRGQADEFCLYCPGWERLLRSYERKIKELNRQSLNIFQNIRHLNKKQFSEKVMAGPEKFRTILYGLYNDFTLFEGKVEMLVTPKKLFKMLSEWQ